MGMVIRIHHECEGGIKYHISVSGVQEKIFYPRVKTQISLSGVQEKIFYHRVKSQ